MRVVVQTPQGHKQCGQDAPCRLHSGASVLPPDQALLPPAPHGFEGYRFLREYFAFPQRYLFFELTGFQDAFAQATGDEVDLVIALDETDTRLEGRVDKILL